MYMVCFYNIIIRNYYNCLNGNICIVIVKYLAFKYIYKYVYIFVAAFNIYLVPQL